MVEIEGSGQAQGFRFTWSPPMPRRLLFPALLLIQMQAGIRLMRALTTSSTLMATLL